MKEIYLDNSATTRVFPEVAQLVSRMMCEDYGNPSSMHLKGVEAERNVKNARETLAKILKFHEKEIYFTSGGTESDNLALIGCAMANHRAGKHIITTKIEHPAVLQTCDYLEKQGFEVTYLSVDAYGVISLEDLEAKKEEEGTTISLIKGVLSELKIRGYQVGGFKAYVTSDVLIGAGLSSSAAFETIVGTIVSGLYNDMTISAVDIANILPNVKSAYTAAAYKCYSHSDPIA